MRARHVVHGRVVYRVNGDVQAVAGAEHPARAAVAKITGQYLQIIQTGKVQIALIIQGRQCGVNLRLRAAQRERAAAVGPGADGRATRQIDVQRTLAHRELRGGHHTIHVVDADQVCAGETQSRVFVYCLRARRSDQRRIV